MRDSMSVSLKQRQVDADPFFRNLQLLAEQSELKDDGKTTAKVLDKLLGELSFWNHLAEAENNEGEERKHSSRASCATWSSTEQLSFASRNNRRGSTKTMQTSEISTYEHKQLNGAVWKTAIDPNTGRTYYYDSLSRKTQWNKPAELIALEKQRKEEQRRKAVQFFEEMEKNLRESLKRGELIPGIPQTSVATTSWRPGSLLNPGAPREPMLPLPNDAGKLVKSSRVRTISGMDEVLLAELRDDHSQHLADRSTAQAVQLQCVPPAEEGRPPIPSKRHPRQTVEDESVDISMELSPELPTLRKDHHPLYRAEHTSHSSGSLSHVDSSENLAGECFLDEPIHLEGDDMIADLTDSASRPVAQHTRRNTGGTIYLENTIYNPDIQATIKCVCGVYRAHILQGAGQTATGSPVSVAKDAHIEGFESFDAKVFRDKRAKRNAKDNLIPSIPSLADVLAFYEEFYRRSQMEHDTIIMSLIYVERLIKATNGTITPSPDSWRSILFACMVLASKVWDDLSMWNVDFSNISAATNGLASFTLARINELELALLKALSFDVRVPASEYAKYYFLIRTMLLRSGLVQEGSRPLQRKKEDDESFSKLESLTNRYQDQTLPKPKMDHSASSPSPLPRPGVARNRVMSLDGVLNYLNAGNKAGPVLRDNVCLEQLLVG